MDTSMYLRLLIGFVIIIWVETCIRQKRKTRVTRLPPGPIAWPIIGNLHHLAGKSAHRDVAKLSAKYGPIFTLMLGSRPAVVISSGKWAKEFLQTHDKEFGNRVENAVAKGVALGSIAVSQTGEYWRQMRKIATLELLSPKKIEACQGLRIEAIRKAMVEIASEKGKVVGIRQLTAKIMSELVTGLVFSSSLSKQSMQLMRMIDALNDASGGLIISDYLPFLGFLDARAKLGLARFLGARDRLMKEMLTLRQSEYKEHHPQCLLDLLLDLQQEEGYLVDNRDQAIYGFLMGLLVAGIDTTSSTVEWAMTELMRHPEKLKKVREEMEREVVRTERNIDDDVLDDKEVVRLRYLHAVLNETLRLHPPAPFLLNRESMEKCVVGEGEYELPKGTLVYINVWQIGRDPHQWEKPEEFIPERFYVNDSKEDPIQQKQKEHFLLAFGGGRRGCPGKTLGHSSAKIVMANLLYAFEWKMSNDNAPLMDMVEKFGLVSLKKKIPLVTIPTPQHFAKSSKQN